MDTLCNESMLTVIKRDLTEVPFNPERITKAVQNAGVSASQAAYIAGEIQKHLQIESKELVEIQEIQALVIKYLDYLSLHNQRNHYLNYMTERNEKRKRGATIVDIFNDVVAHTHENMNENANINTHGAMGKMLRTGSEVSKSVYLFTMPKQFAKAHESGRVHYHDLDFHDLTTTCVQIDLQKLFGGEGFDTGHGNVRPPKRIESYASLACIAIQANQNDQHGGQSIPCFDYYLAPGVVGSYQKHLQNHLATDVSLLERRSGNQSLTRARCKRNLNTRTIEMCIEPPAFNNSAFDKLRDLTQHLTESEFNQLIVEAHNKAMEDTDENTFQAMEAVVHNLNTMHSRAGAQIPFSNINYGTDTSVAGRMIIRNILQALYDGMGKGEIPIFPIHVFKVKAGVNKNPGDPNYDLFQQAWKVTSKRLFPNYSNLDSSFNLPYYVPGKPETEVAYMGCRTRVIGNIYDKTREVVTGRGNIAFSSINLPRIALEVTEKNGNIKTFYEILEDRMQLVLDQLLYRFNILSKKYIRNYPFLMGQGIWLDSDKLDAQTPVGEVLKHGTLSIGFVGLAETLKCLTGFHHGENGEAQNLGLQMIKHMRDFCDRQSEKLQLNITLLATPAESTAGRFLKADKEKYGVIKGVTDREYYTNSFHVPVYHNLNMFDKIKIEAPYHKYTNAGHIGYVEADALMQLNPEAIGAIIKMMFDMDMGYGAVNVKVDYDPVCHYTGVIGDICPRCGRKEKAGVPFNRIRRITGYLAGSLESFNDAKIAEVRDRVIHSEVVTDPTQLKALGGNCNG